MEQSSTLKLAGMIGKVICVRDRATDTLHHITIADAKESWGRTLLRAEGSEKWFIPDDHALDAIYSH